MNPLVALAAIPVPDPLPLPAPPWFLHALLLLTFFLHLVPMNLVLGGTLLSAILRLGPDGRDPQAGPVLDRVRRGLPSLVAAAITFGVAPLLFVQTLFGRLFFPATVAMAWWWFAVIPLLIGAYYATYALSYSVPRPRPLLGWIAAGLFGGIAFLYSNAMSLMLRPDAVAAHVAADARGFALNLDDPTFLPRWLHMLLGAVAVAGMALAAYGLWLRRRDPAGGRWAIRRGALVFAVVTAANALAGTWWLMALPGGAARIFMGRDPLATAGLAVGILTGLAALALAVRAVAAPDPARSLLAAALVLPVTLVAMILNRDQVRAFQLEAVGFRGTSWVEPQVGPIVLFVVLLLGAVATLVYLARAMAGPPAGEAGRTRPRSREEVGAAR